MDRTQLFKASLMAVKLQQRKGESDGDSKQRILPSSKKAGERDEFGRQAKEVCQKITSLRDVLLENRCAYMRIGQHLKSAAQMSDEQRDLIDRESEKFFAYYVQHLAQLRADWKGAKRKPQRRQHIEAVLDLLEAYLRSVQHIYAEQRKYRVQHELETYRLLKLAADKRKIPVRPGGERKKAQRAAAQRSSAEEEGTASEDDWDRGSSSSHSNATTETDTSDGWQLELQRRTKPSSNALRKRHGHAAAVAASETAAAKSDAATAKAMGDSTDGDSANELKSQAQSTQQVALDEDIETAQQLAHEEAQAASSELSPEDVQMFEQENVQLYQQLQGLAEEVELIEKNVVDIAQLQDIFTEKVSLQQHNIERIANAVVGATENVKDANEQIRQAIQRNAGLRVWSLFFLLVMSFALLFLDWYYD